MIRLGPGLAVAIGLAMLLAHFAAPPARADHGQWESRQVWIEPVIEERTRVKPGRWVSQRVWVPPQTVSREVTVTVPVKVEYPAFVPSGYWTLVRVRVESHQVRCRSVWRWYQDCPNLWGPCRTVYGPREECQRVDTSKWELQRRWVDTSRWETRTRVENQRQTRTVERVIPGRWETRSRWRPGGTETYRHEVEPGRWETRRVWVELPHGPVVPSVKPSGCRPSGIYKVSSNYAGNTQWTDADGTIHYGTRTSSKPNPWWAVSLGSVSKGRTSAYDSRAFNGRGYGADGLLLAGRFYRNYLPAGDCFDAVGVVFFQDDTVVSGDLDQPDPSPETPPPGAGPAPNQPSPAPTETPPVEPTEELEPTPTPTPRPNPDPTRSPSPGPGPDTRPPTKDRPALDPGGEFLFAVVIEGSETPTGPGRESIQVLRGAPVEVYLLPRLDPPEEDPAAEVTFRSWRFESGPNDHPRAPAAGSELGPLQPLRLRLDSPAPAGRAGHEIGLSVRVRVVAGDGRSEDFEMPVALPVAVHYQAIA